VYDRPAGLAGNVVSCILEDAQGNLWMSTNRGISRFDTRLKSFTNYSVADGLPGADLTGWGACAKSQSGEMFFGGFSGATAFFPDAVMSDAGVPSVVLTDFRLSGAPVEIGAASPLAQSITYTHAVTLSHKQSIFAVEFSALSYLHPAALRYRYMLEGLDQQWNEADSDARLASYTTLPAGVYTFRAQSRTSDGNWSIPGATLRIEILPAWWQTWWFRSGVGLALLGLAFAAYRLRVASIRQRRQILHVPYQVGQAKLHDDMAFPHIPTVSGKIVAAQDAVEFLSQDLHQHLTTPRRINLEHRVQARPKTPRPPLLAVLAMTGLVHVEPPLLREVFQQGFVGNIQGLAQFADHLGQLPPRNSHTDHVTQELADRRVRGVAGALEVRN